MIYYPQRKCNAIDKKAPLTEFVELRTDILIPIGELEESLYDPVWNSPQMSDELGVVALSEDFIKHKNLPHAMRYPWDKDKHVYVLTFHHSIHCLRYLRHHCMNILREDMFCHADDTPRYTGRLHSQAGKDHPQAGIGQMRKCRDFNKLFEWSNEHSACYTDIGNGNPKDYFRKDCVSASKA
ncbi:Phenylalanine aminomutase (L-beta-phenylalanine forming) [Lachnellula willkommii]|uniref:Phenylalanine aminomutase (L-beta-phenylalanine forming) n=1 Tax=Lachnellula willkommii TaxID=215461 RepID=A0A559MIK4_9HELO|nr:Phenylalanine aminomutase (L-beta-phenylalanine forming) [Lachnellula willkommii]